MAVQYFAQVGVCVSDLERSRRFYCELLGFREVARLQATDSQVAQLLGLDDLDLHMCFLERDGMRIELLWYARPRGGPGTVPRPMTRFGLTHFTVRVDDLEQTVAGLRREGVTILDETRIHNPQFGAHVVFALDPDGVRLELIEAPGDASLALGEPVR